MKEMRQTEVKNLAQDHTIVSKDQFLNRQSGSMFFPLNHCTVLPLVALISIGNPLLLKQAEP